MGDSKQQIQSFEDLTVWQYAQDLSVSVYKITQEFPQSEQFGITNQIRRASSSISANIAEGFGHTTVKDKLQFYAIAHGSLLETKNFIYLSYKIGYLDNANKDNLIKSVTELQMLLAGFIRSTRKRLNND